MQQRPKSTGPNDNQSAPQPRAESSLPGNLRTAKEGLKMTLGLAQTALDGLPIPGAKTIISGVLTIIQTFETKSSNVETLKRLENHLQYLVNDILKPIAQMEPSSISPELYRDVGNLIKDLEEFVTEWEKQSHRGSFRRFIEANKDQDDLKTVADRIRMAIERFQASGSVNIQVAGARQERVINNIESHTMSIEEKAAMREYDRLVNGLPRAGTAGHDSIRSVGRTACFSGTRIEVLDTIKFWAKDSNPDAHSVFWLDGKAGLGKTTIAQTIAEYARERGFLGGSFFFSRDDETLEKASLVFPTLAFQLAQFDPAFKSSIGKALEKNLDLGHSAIHEQLDKLIIGPLSASATSGVSHGVRVVLLVLDALDECKSDKETTIILQELLANIHKVPFSLRILITSRPESHIRKVFNSDKKHARFGLHEIAVATVRQEVELYLRASLADIPKQLELTEIPDWPLEEDIARLVAMAQNMFLHAAIAIRFIGNDRVRNPRRQLDVLIGAREAVNAKPYAELDSLYLRILRNAFPEDCEREDYAQFRSVVGSIILCRSPVPTEVMAKVIGIRKEDVLNTLYHLHSIFLCISENSEDYYFVYHPSFIDFIFDRKRCTDESFAMDKSSQEGEMAIRCWRLIMGAKQQYRDAQPKAEPIIEDEVLEGLKITLKMDSLINDQLNYRAGLELDSLWHASVDDSLGLEMDYANRFWAHHLSNAEPSTNSHIIEKLQQFLSSDLLDWFNYTTKIGAGVESLVALRRAYFWMVDKLPKGRRVSLEHALDRQYQRKMEVESAYHKSRNEVYIVPMDLGRGHGFYTRRGDQNLGLHETFDGALEGFENRFRSG